MKVLKKFNVQPNLPKKIQKLVDISDNLYWTWEDKLFEVFNSINHKKFKNSKYDPKKLFGELNENELRKLSNNKIFVDKVDLAKKRLDKYLAKELWYQKNTKENTLTAYFSPEFGIVEILPQYSGGLGILAGDHLKAASDLGVNLIGVGLLYKGGYFSQSLSTDGWQIESYPVIDPDALPIELLKDKKGNILYIDIPTHDGKTFKAHIWKASVGRIPLLLLDSDVSTNDSFYKTVTDKLYGGDTEHRILQEILLGVGGIKALNLYSKEFGEPIPDVYHMNEGHAGFMCLERISNLMLGGKSYDEALELTKSSTVFTTHTPVPAGIDRFPIDIVKKYISPITKKANINFDNIMKLGDENSQNNGEVLDKKNEQKLFNMAVFGLKTTNNANGVSKLHGAVSRDMFHKLWKDFDVDDVPITSITNGVHYDTWTNPLIKKIMKTSYAGKKVFTAKENLMKLWKTKQLLKSKFVKKIRKRLKASWIERGFDETELNWIDDVFNENALTIGFARRASSYKRLTLMLNDKERFKALLTNKERPVQIIVAGKSHPNDEEGKSIMQKLIQFSDCKEVRNKIIFVPNYDIRLAKLIYSGCDVWLNNPIRPLEACGTSGMKAAMNGALNLSILDGWWDELYNGNNGWAIPSAKVNGDTEKRDTLEAEALYDILEEKVLPLYYSRGSNNIPARWLEMMKNVHVDLVPKISARRMVQDYVQKLYIPTAKLYKSVEKNCKSFIEWKNKVKNSWNDVKILSVTSYNADSSISIGDELQLKAIVNLGKLEPTDVNVQMAYGVATPDDDIENVKYVDLKFDSTDKGISTFTGKWILGRSGSFAYTIRIVPKHRLLRHPGNFGLIKLASN